MAVRLNRNHSESVLRRIQTSQLVNRLQKHALGLLRGPPKEANPEGDLISMTDSQVRATCFLIERSLAKAEAPKQIELSGKLTLEQLIAQSVPSS